MSLGSMSLGSVRREPRRISSSSKCNWIVPCDWLYSAQIYSTKNLHAYCGGQIFLFFQLAKISFCFAQAPCFGLVAAKGDVTTKKNCFERQKESGERIHDGEVGEILGKSQVSSVVLFLSSSPSPSFPGRAGVINLLPFLKKKSLSPLFLVYVVYVQYLSGFSSFVVEVYFTIYLFSPPLLVGTQSDDSFEQLRYVFPCSASIRQLYLWIQREKTFLGESRARSGGGRSGKGRSDQFFAVSNCATIQQKKNEGGRDEEALQTRKRGRSEKAGSLLEYLWVVSRALQ